MTAITICTSIFEAARPFVPAYIRGVAALERTVSTRLSILLANDNFVAPGEAFAALSPRTRIVDARVDGIGAVRRRMIEAALQLDGDILIFCDVDDVLLPGAAKHLAALEEADISYGDLLLIDGAGTSLGQSFFNAANVPDEVASPDALVHRNFMGFSNTAVRRSAILPAAAAIPACQVAADWWFFTMLLESGLHARNCKTVVAQYRQHGLNTLGGRPASTPAAVLARCELFLAHQAALPPLPSRAALVDRVTRLVEAIHNSPEEWSVRLTAACSGPGVWFEELGIASSLVDYS